MIYEHFFNASFIPSKITVGLYKYHCTHATNNVNAGYISWKDKNKQWRCPSTFERLSGYKPHKQNDSTKELTKIIKNCVNEYDNTPVKSFKIISYDEDIYTRNNHVRYSGDYVWDVLLEDPRGFVIGVRNDEFFELLRYANWNLVDGVLNVEVVYASTSANNLVLLPTSHTKYKELSKQVSDEIEDISYITKSKLQVGHVYKASKIAPFTHGNYMYLGIHNTYSIACHIDAVRTGTYTIDEFIDNERRNTGIWQQTTEGRLIFYRVGSSEQDWNNYKSVYNPHTIYLTRPNISKCFIEEVELDKDAKMYNDPTKPVTYENVLEDMQKSIIFNKLNLTHYTLDVDMHCKYKDLSYNAFELLFAYNDLAGRNQTNSDYIPHYYPKPCAPFNIPVKTNAIVDELTYLRVKDISDKNVKDINTTKFKYSIENAKLHNAYYGNSSIVRTCDSFIDCYKQLKPQIPDLTLETGYKVSDELASIFIPLYRNQSYEFGY